MARSVRDAPAPRRRGVTGGLALGIVVAIAAVAAPAAIADQYDPNGSTYALVSYDGGVLAGTNLQGRTFSAAIDSTTLLRAAAIDQIPTDPIRPCRQLAADYNNALVAGLGDGGAGIQAAITSLAAARCNARVVGPALTSTPVGLPPNPIRSFLPVA